MVLLCLFLVSEGAEFRNLQGLFEQFSKTVPCAGIQGAANTGNAQNLIDLIQYGFTADDFEFEKIGSTVGVNLMNKTACDQQVNRTVSAFG